MQTVEKFGVDLDPQQLARIEQWLETLRIVWNDARSLLLFQRLMTRPYREKVMGDNGKPKNITHLAPCCPMAVSYYRQIVSQPPSDADLFQIGAYLTTKRRQAGDDATAEAASSEETFLHARCSWILAKDRNGGAVGQISGLPFTHPQVVDSGESLIRVGECCPLPGRDHSPPRLGYQPVAPFTLQYWFTQKHIRQLVEEGLYSPEFAQQFADVPAWFVRGVCEDLSAAWSAFLKGDRGEPRFKKPGEINSLSYGDAAKLDLSPDENGIDGFVQLPKLGRLPARNFWRKWCQNSLEPGQPRPLMVLQLVRDRDDRWYLHLTGWEMQRADYYAIAFQQMLSLFNFTKKDKPADFIPRWQWNLIPIICQFIYLPWRLQRTAKTTLTVPGEGYNAAIDDLGMAYTVLPRRHQDGAIDPHNRIAKLDAQILHLQRATQVQRDRLKADREAGITTNQGGRLAANETKLSRLSAQRARIIENNLKKMAHFVSERSMEVEVHVKQENQKRTKKTKPKRGAGELPVEFLPNGAERVSEQNRVTATVAPGKFLSLLEQEARERCQIVRIIKSSASKKTRRVKTK